MGGYEEETIRDRWRLYGGVLKGEPPSQRVRRSLQIENFIAAGFSSLSSVRDWEVACESAAG